MRKLTCMQTTDISQWPSEIRSEFSPILDKFQQERGFLSENVKLASSEIQPPLVPEKVFDDLDLQDIKSIMNSIYPAYSTIDVLRLL